MYHLGVMPGIAPYVYGCCLLALNTVRGVGSFIPCTLGIVSMGLLLVAGVAPLTYSSRLLPFSS